MLNGLQTKCLLVIVFKRISTPLWCMTNHVMYICDACNNNSNKTNNMQQQVKLFYPFQLLIIFNEKLPNLIPGIHSKLD